MPTVVVGGVLVWLLMDSPLANDLLEHAEEQLWTWWQEQPKRHRRPPPRRRTMSEMLNPFFAAPHEAKRE